MIEVLDITLVTTPRRNLAWQYLAVLCGAIVLYVVSCAPGVLWQDSGLIQYRIWHNDIEGFLGLAVAHPLFYLIAIGAKHIPVGELAYRMNLVSAIAAAFAVANMFLLVRLWLDETLPAVIAAVSLAVSHTFWFHASVIETYTLWSALFLVELIMLLQYTKTNRVGYLYLLALFNGLAISVHMLASIPMLCYAIYIVTRLARKDVRIRDLIVIVLLWIAGALPYEYLIIKNILQTSDISGTLASAAFGSRWQHAVLNSSMSMKTVIENMSYIFLNFPTPNILLLFAGCYGLYKISPNRGFKIVLISITILFFVFAFRYTVPDRYAFFIPFYCMVSIFIGIGTYILQRRLNHQYFIPAVLILSLLPVNIYAVAPILARKIQLNISTRDDIPYRDDYTFFLQPWKTGYNGAERFADDIMNTVDNNAVVYADSTTAPPLLYAQEVKEIRPDVKIISGTVNSKDSPKMDEYTIEQLLKERSLYLVSSKPGYCPSFILENYELDQTDILWKITGRKKIP